MIKRTVSAARQIDDLFSFYERNQWVEAARNLVQILEDISSELEDDPAIGKERPDFDRYGYLWILREPYFIAYLPPDIGDIEPAVIITNVVNATWWPISKHVRQVGEIIPWA